jgi:hypothetical protein
MALVVIDEILATAGQTSVLWTIRDVTAEVLTCLLIVTQLITTVTFARVILKVVASWIFEIVAPSMRHASVAFAIVHVDAAIVWLERAVCPAHNLIAGKASKSAVERISWPAREIGPVPELVLINRSPSGTAEVWDRWYAT